MQKSACKANLREIKGLTTMPRTVSVPTFDEVLSRLGDEKFDVSPATEGANRVTGARRVSKNGCAAEIAPSEVKDCPVRILARSGWVVAGEISRLTDRGYQKFFKTSKLEIPATADALRSLHDEELKNAIGAQELYNEAMGTTSDRYVYDRVKGRA
jgi:hypothetical protein